MTLAWGTGVLLVRVAVVSTDLARRAAIRWLEGACGTRDALAVDWPSEV